MRNLRLWLLAAAIASVVGSARADEPAGTTEARALFKKGLAFAHDGELVAAADAFDRAYATSPNYAVLYNLGQAYAALGRSLDAARVLERFLTEGGDKISPARREAVEVLIASERAKLSRLEVNVSPARAEVFLDGRRLPPNPLEPEWVTPGEHVVIATSAGWLTAARPVIVEPGQSTRMSLSLEPIPLAPDSTSSECPLVPFASDRDPASDLASSPAPVHPVPISHQRDIALGVGALGLVLAGSALGVYAWNSGRYDDWQADRQQLLAAMRAGGPDSATLAQNARLAPRAADIQRADDAALGLALAAGGAVVTSLVLWLTGGKPAHRSGLPTGYHASTW